MLDPRPKQPKPFRFMTVKESAQYLKELEDWAWRRDRELLGPPMPDRVVDPMGRVK